MGKNPNASKNRSPAQIANTQNLILRRKSTKSDGGKSIEAFGEGNYTSPMQNGSSADFIGLEKDN
jgi:hypothetical protein